MSDVYKPKDESARLDGGAQPRVACVFIGDELSAAGYRLAGVECWSPSAETVSGVVERATRYSDLIMITAELAAALPAAVLVRAIRDQRPPFVVTPDIRGHVQPDDPVSSLKRQLGLSE